MLCRAKFKSVNIQPIAVRAYAVVLPSEDTVDMCSVSMVRRSIAGLGCWWSACGPFRLHAPWKMFRVSRLNSWARLFRRLGNVPNGRMLFGMFTAGSFSVRQETTDETEMRDNII